MSGCSPRSSPLFSFATQCGCAPEEIFSPVKLCPSTFLVSQKPPNQVNPRKEGKDKKPVVNDKSMGAAYKFSGRRLGASKAAKNVKCSEYNE
jgi:hypothetical protein